MSTMGSKRPTILPSVTQAGCQSLSERPKEANDGMGRSCPERRKWLRVTALPSPQCSPRAGMNGHDALLVALAIRDT